MKLKCKQGYFNATNGIMGFGAKPRRPIEGLTEGKEYIGELVPIVYNVMNQGTTINEDDIKVMIYNDDGNWKPYQLNLFEPA